MTREDFIRECNSIGDLLSFCSEYDCDIMCDVYDDDGRDDYIEENQLMDWVRECRWYELRDWLNDIPTGFDYYMINDCGEWIGIDDYNAREFKQDILEWADECGDVWDDPAEEDTKEDDEPDEEDAQEFEAGCDFAVLVQASSDAVRVEVLRRKPDIGLPF